MVGQALGALGGGSFGRNVIGQAVIEVTLDNSGVERAMTNTQKLVAGMAVAGLGAAVSAAMSFESAMAQVEKASGLSGDALAELGGEFRRLATDEIPMSAAALAEIGAMAAQMGVEARHIGTFTEAVAKLATASDVVGEQGAQKLAQFINVVGDSYGNIERVSSALVDLGNNSNATESQILEMATRVAAAGRQIGMTTGEVLGMSEALVSLGIPAEMGGTAISRVILEIYSAAQKGGDKLAEFADVAGLTSEQFQKLVATNPTEALTRFVGGLGDADRLGRNVVQVLDEIGFGNVRVRDALLRLTGSQDAMNESLARGNTAYAENIALQEEFGVFAGTTANQARLLWNQLTDLGIVLGQTLLPTVRTSVGLFSDLVQAFAGAPGEVQSLTVALVGLVALGPPLVRMLQMAITYLNSLRVGAQGAALSLGMSGGLAAAVVAAAAIGAFVLWNRDQQAAMKATQDRAEELAARLDYLRETAADFPSVRTEEAQRQLGQLSVVVDEMTRRFENLGVDAPLDRLRGDIEAQITVLRSYGMTWDEIARVIDGLSPELMRLAADIFPELRLALIGTEESTKRNRDELGNLRRSQREAAQGSRVLTEASGDTAGGLADMGDWAAATGLKLVELGPRAIAAAAAMKILESAISGGSKGMPYGRAGGSWATPRQVTDAQEIIAWAERQIAASAYLTGTVEGLADSLIRGAGVWDEYGSAATKSAGGSRAAAAGMSEAEKEAEALREEAIRAAEALRDMDSRARANLIATQLWAAGYRDVETAIAAIHPVALRMLGDLQAQEEFIAAVTQELVGLKEEAQKLTAQQYAQQIATGMLEAGYVSVEAALAAVGLEERAHIATLQREEGLVRDLTEALLGLSMGAERAKEELASLTGETVRELDTLGSVLVTALRRQQEAARDAELRRIQSVRDAQLDAHNARLAQIDRELNAQLTAIDAEIAALQGEAESDRLRSLQEQIEELRKAEALAWDPRERARIQQQIADVEKQITQFHRDQEVERLRASQQALRDRARAQQEAAERELRDRQEALNRQEAAARESFERMTETWLLESEARQMIAAGELERISSLISQHVPEWARSWQSFGESVINGPLSSIRGEITRIMGMMSDMRALASSTSVAPAALPPIGNIAPPTMSYADRLNAAWAPLAATAPEFVVKDWRKQVVLAGGVPTFDTGAVLTAPTLGLLAMGSQAQPEIVTPERLMADVFRGVLAESGGLGANFEARIFVGDREIQDIVRVEIDRKNEWDQSTGARLQRGR